MGVGFAGACHIAQGSGLDKLSNLSADNQRTVCVMRVFVVATHSPGCRGDREEVKAGPCFQDGEDI